MISKILKYLNNLNIRQVLILAGVAAGLMFAAIYMFLSAYTEKEDDDGSEGGREEKTILKTVVVAKTDIAPRIKITEEMLEVKEMPKDSVPSDAIEKREEILEKPARMNILAGDVITSRKIYKSEDQTGFVGTIPPDCRAISIPVNDVTGVSGFVKAGDRVDLMLVENDGTSAMSNIILQNVLLLSINKSMESGENEDGKNTAIENPTIVTVALRPHEALKLVSATKLGDIYLMLRPAKPLENYVEGIEYKVISAKATEEKEERKPEEKKEEVVEEIKEEKKKSAVIEIIEGAQLVTPPAKEKSEGK